MGVVLVDEALRAIEVAFDGVARESGITLHEADAIDDHKSVEDRAKARANDAETRWQDVPAALIERFSCQLSFLDGKGFHYYIPAYMRWTLLNCVRSNSFSCDHAIYSLEGAHFGQEPVTSALQFFTPGQKMATAIFLQAMCHPTLAQHVDSAHANLALERFWGQYAS